MSSDFTLYYNSLNYSTILCSDCHSSNFSLCISSDNTVYSIGFSKVGAHGHKKNFIFPPKQIKHLKNIKMISCGYNHSIFVDYNGNIYSCGQNKIGRLGQGDFNEDIIYIPRKIMNIPLISQISCGDNFTMCLTYDRDLYSFGNNKYGQLGLGHTVDSSSPQLIQDLNNIEFVECGGFHSICRSYNGDYYSWGDNRFHQLSHSFDELYCNKPIQCSNWPDNIMCIKCGLYHALLLISNGIVYSFGKNLRGQLGLNDENIKQNGNPTIIKDIPKIKRIECGYVYCMLIDINNDLWIFGGNTKGQLGLGDKEDRFKPIKHPTLEKIIDISHGGWHTFVKTIDNEIYAFGSNNRLQFGSKTSNKHQLTPIQVLQGKEDIWCTFFGKSKQKSARK